jgi:hypothetical protein
MGVSDTESDHWRADCAAEYYLDEFWAASWPTSTEILTFGGEQTVPAVLRTSYMNSALNLYEIIF